MIATLFRPLPLTPLALLVLALQLSGEEPAVERASRLEQQRADASGPP